MWTDIIVVWGTISSVWTYLCVVGCISGYAFRDIISLLEGRVVLCSGRISLVEELWEHCHYSGDFTSVYSHFGCTIKRDSLNCKRYN
jgi:hypothetical protein